MTVKSDTQTIRLETDARTAFDFLADPGNLPMWAVGFCRGIRRDGNGWIVQTRTGECPLEIEADARRGTIDFHMQPAPHIKASAYSRVLGCDAGSEYVFTQFSLPAAPDELFQASVESLKEELVVLRSVLRARHGCPA
jgi:hypothetical protein